MAHDKNYASLGNCAPENLKLDKIVVPPICQQLSNRKTAEAKIIAVRQVRKHFKSLKIVRCGNPKCPVCTKV